MTTESPWAVEPLGITIKYGKGYEDTWITIRGSDAVVREQLISVFGLDPEESKDLTTAALVLNATNAAHALHLLAGGNQGSAVSGRGGRGGSPASSWNKARDTQPEQPAAEPEDPAKVARERGLKEIGEVQTVAALQRWWAENQEIFKDAEVARAWKAKGKALQAK